MIYREILKQIDSHTWWSEEAPSVTQTVIYELRCFVSMARLIKRPFLSIAVMITTGDYFYEETPEDERYELYKFFYDSMRKDKTFIARLIRVTEQRKKEYYKEISKFLKNRHSMSNMELWKCYKSFMDKYQLWLEYPALVECIDVFTSYYLEKEIKKEMPNASPAELMDAMAVLAIPKILSFIEEERLDFLSACVLEADNLEKGIVTGSLKRKFKLHSDKYFWALNNFKTVRYLDADHFIERAKEEVAEHKAKLAEEKKKLANKVQSLKNRAKGLEAKHSFSKELKLHFEICELFGESIDKRKATMLRTNYFIGLFCGEIAKRSNLKKEAVQMYTLGEIGELLTKGRLADPTTLKKRWDCCAFVYVLSKNKEGLDTYIFYGDDAREILRHTTHKIGGEIQGQVASAPVKKLKGAVQIILDTSKHKFKKGNILVTSMTRPDFVPLMRKAAGIITDEGGITCHAAVISRELGIPCIIGTKFATKVLKDGDIVEMDCVNGTVKKVE